MSSLLRDAYQALIDASDLKSDVAQARGIAALDDLLASLTSTKNQGWRAWWGQKSASEIQGVYLHGPVGRGKTFIMDLFFDHVPGHLPKRRVHFHAFMLEVHAFLHAQRQAGGDQGVDDSLPKFAAHIAQAARVLCFDEFHVTDVADAMILQRLFTALFASGVVVVMTSNVAPPNLYKNGLRHEVFLPFIDLVQTRMNVMEIAGPRDYRVDRLRGRPVYFYPLGPQADTQVDVLVRELLDGMPGEAETLPLPGRSLVIPHAGHGVARISFADLCEKPLGATDYLALAGAYHTIVLDHVPKLTYDRRNEAKRFITLIDILYERHRRIIISADASPEKLHVDGDHADEFVRTVSRLKEMQSQDYLLEVA